MKTKNKTIPIKETSLELGLTSLEAEERKQANLHNKTKNGSSRSVAGIILKEIFTYFNMVYMIITAILIYVGEFTQLTFLFVIVPNTLISIIQQIKSKKTVDKLSILVKSSACVVRDGKEIEVATEDVVRDDIIKFGLGDQICVDAVVLNGECKVNESMLTGESLSIKKESNSKLFAGSYVTSGSVYARATSVGESSYIQTLTAQAKRYKRPKSEILNALNSIIKVIGIAIIPISIFLYLRTAEVVKTAGAVIGMIPSGMFLLTTIALAVSVVRLSKNNTLVQELYCIEMLARVDTLAMDKTGTITDGTMNVSEVKAVEGATLARPIEEIVGNMLTNVTTDNPTSLALKKHFSLQNTLETKKYYAFSSETKFFAVDYGKSGVYFVGAPEYVCDISKYENIQQEVEMHSRKGERVLLLCHGANYNDESFDKAQNNPLSIISLVDNVRQDAIETIKFFKENNVDLKVISGDNEVTVSEIAKIAGLEGAERYVSLQDKSDDEVRECANKYNVFGRVSPKQKEILIKSMKAEGHTVAMVGDGVNDILALREADCSVAIGAGSEAAKNVSHLILVDSKFSNMQNVVSEGRRCINNLQSTSTMFLTKTCIAIILSIFCILSSFNYPFSPNQLMVLEMFAIGVPGFFFALQQNRNLVKGHFLDSVLIKSFSQALVALICILPLYFIIGNSGFEENIVETMIVLITTFNSLIVLIRIAYPYNKYRLVVTLSMIIMSLLAFTLLSNVMGLNLFAETPFNNYLGLTQLSPSASWLMLGFVLVLFPLQYFLNKLVMRYMNHTRQKIDKANTK